MKIRIAAATDMGKERTNNEDAYVVCPDLAQQDWTQSETKGYVTLGRYGSLMVVADGMGGASAGEVASAIAMKAVSEAFSMENVARHCEEGTFTELLVRGISVADEAINKRVARDPDTIGMGTTIVMCWIVGTSAYIAWCGDSRCYVYSPACGLRRLTKDHSLVQEMVDRGEITEREAFSHPDNNVITRALGDVDSVAEPGVATRRLSANDEILLCTDGLSGYCRDKAIEKVFDRCYADASQCCGELVRASLDAGGSDNVCVAVASVIDDGQHSPAKPTWGQRLKRLLGIN